jgi:hypothetical protein
MNTRGGKGFIKYCQERSLQTEKDRGSEQVKSSDTRRLRFLRCLRSVELGERVPPLSVLAAIHALGAGQKQTRVQFRPVESTLSEH